MPPLMRGAPERSGKKEGRVSLGYLTPGRNGGSGEMPSGHARPCFELAGKDFATYVMLPAGPRHTASIRECDVGEEPRLKWA